MKLLIDANLSWRLSKLLAPLFTVCLHVNRTGLKEPASDADIWDWANQHGFDFLLTNDADFDRILNKNGPPPKVILLKTGNQSTTSVYQSIVSCFNEIELLHKDQDLELLEIN